MRDDLHKSVSPRTAWAKVLRLACQHAAKDDLVDAMIRAIRKDAVWLREPWGKRFEATLELGTSDLFSHERVRDGLLALVTSSPNPDARRSCEIALGCLAREGGVVPNLKGLVIDEAMRVFAADRVELVASRVALKFDLGQAAQVRKLLDGLLPHCDLSQDPPSRARTEVLPIDSVLDLPLTLLSL